MSKIKILPKYPFVVVLQQSWFVHIIALSFEWHLHSTCFFYSIQDKRFVSDDLTAPLSLNLITEYDLLFSTFPLCFHS